MLDTNADSYQCQPVIQAHRYKIFHIGTDTGDVSTGDVRTLGTISAVLEPATGSVVSGIDTKSVYTPPSALLVPGSARSSDSAHQSSDGSSTRSSISSQGGEDMRETADEDGEEEEEEEQSVYPIQTDAVVSGGRDGGGGSLDSEGNYARLGFWVFKSHVM